MKEINLNSYLRLWRIKDWRAYFFMAALGFIIANGFLFPLGDIFLFWAIVFLLLAFGFSVNECFDIREDKYRADKLLIVTKEMSFKKGLVFSILIGALGIILSAIFGLKIFLFCLFSLLVSFFYSAPPFRFKSRPFFDLISHGLFAGVFIFISPLLIFRTELTIFHYLMAFSIFYLSIILELRNHLEDYATDEEAGLRTTVCVFGYQNSEKLLRYLAIFYPLILLPIFSLFFPQYLFLFFFFTIVFLFLFLLSKNYRLIKNYRVLDAYAFFSLLLLLIAKLR